MIVDIVVLGSFAKLPQENSIFTLSCDLLKLHEQEVTLSAYIDHKLEGEAQKGCICSFNESVNFCECEGYEYEGSYKILEITEHKEGKEK